ncbi:MAG: threonylcarbamoyl-AMP synthase [Acidobacteria bacterium]|nr:MAG: threonylcarbamoyl-AMP synthase [Acidobacteriota bacterium]PYY03257.1 MAG: threonylcarbamoyl-AMP synthase [Acidobacteriota bacterium]PYY23615.1 MAG: threonylcarbamoyl-AMP synthase [Acidobacteriota bacterium]
MKTVHLKVRAEEAAPEHPSIREAAAILKVGGLVAIPTETVYGLAADALDPGAIARIFVAKERPSWDPLIVHVANFEMISQVAGDFPERAKKLAERFWPGPLTLLLKRHRQLPLAVTAGRETVAVRIPAHPVARAVITSAGLPLAAPSANRFGHTSPTTAEHVMGDLEGRIDAVLDSGPTQIGVESTVLDPLRTPPLLLRPGGVTREQLEELLGQLEMYSAPANEAPQALASPGLAARHYAPQAQLVLVDGTQENFLAVIEEQVSKLGDRAEYVGAMAPKDWLDEQSLSRGGLVIFDWGSWSDPAQLAHNLFAGLRYLDKPGVSVILCPLPSATGLGLALRDRLLRAAR